MIYGQIHLKDGCTQFEIAFIRKTVWIQMYDCVLYTSVVFFTHT